MPLASMRSNNLGGSATGPPKSLFIDGLDVLKQPGTSTNRYGVPIESCVVTEASPGGISGMTFDLEDPSISLPSPIEGAQVRFHDNTRDRPIFLGYVQSFSPAVFGLGRVWSIEAIGIEVVLDWMAVASDVTFAAGLNTVDCIQSLYALSTGIGAPLRVLQASSGTRSGNQATPLGTLDTVAVPTFGILANAVTVTAGTTLREGIRQLTDQNIGHNLLTKIIGTNPSVSVDFYTGLRAFLDPPSDYDALTVNDAVAGPLIAADLEHTTDAAGIVRQVYVKGGNATGSGIVGDGSGAVGPVATISDSTILTAADRDAKGYAYLSDKHSGVRGSFRLESYDPSTNVRAASTLTITDPQLGLSSYSTTIGQIVRRFLGSGKEDWTITYGGLPASFASAVRRLTRAVTS